MNSFYNSALVFIGDQPIYVHETLMGSSAMQWRLARLDVLRLELYLVGSIK